ncbi:MAG: phosphatidylglycerophosphatase A [Candidatus Marinimicrobia bacterium]|nr:phosphatidylglycerophosphatase A [Candidatus Neomarinimicrobiota bacterium]MBL7023627.1 phosphatidylglycerophosphatase A [Candidatus Neomarinimicrobiota bacterium]MBL7109814.1 phosphatidylglycerophosphatase A [Candidatus Neomarinimicrobiota bacterium]
MNQLISTFFGVGYLPKAPGTWGSLVALIIWWFVPIDDIFLQTSLIMIAIVLGVYTSAKFSKEINKSDPSEVVIDEVVGMWIALFIIPKSIFLYVTSFILFRILDITKPLIIDKAQKLPNGWGIMMDDVIAGLIAWMIVLGIYGIYIG